MSLTRMHVIATAAWLVLVTGTLGFRMATSGAPALGESLGWLLVGTLPVLVLLRVFRGAPPETVAQVLYNTEHAGDTQHTGSRKNETR